MFHVEPDPDEFNDFFSMMTDLSEEDCDPFDGEPSSYEDFSNLLDDKKFTIEGLGDLEESDVMEMEIETEEEEEEEEEIICFLKAAKSREEHYQQGDFPQSLLCSPYKYHLKMKGKLPTDKLKLSLVFANTSDCPKASKPPIIANQIVVVSPHERVIKFALYICSFHYKRKFFQLIVSGENGEKIWASSAFRTYARRRTKKTKPIPSPTRPKKTTRGQMINQNQNQQLSRNVQQNPMMFCNPSFQPMPYCYVVVMPSQQNQSQTQTRTPNEGNFQMGFIPMGNMMMNGNAMFVNPQMNMMNATRFPQNPTMNVNWNTPLKL